MLYKFEVGNNALHTYLLQVICSKNKLYQPWHVLHHCKIDASKHCLINSQVNKNIMIVKILHKLHTIYGSVQRFRDCMYI